MPPMPHPRSRHDLVGRSLTPFEAAVARVVSSRSPGEVVTYGEVALEAGYPRAARAVGGVLARSEGLPWWRVVASNGRLVPGHEDEQTRLLLGEGVPVAEARVRIRRGGQRSANAP
jgi:methylated-DNA-protein-cysteine methyltransferase-like protein